MVGSVYAAANYGDNAPRERAASGVERQLARGSGEGERGRERRVRGKESNYNLARGNKDKALHRNIHVHDLHTRPGLVLRFQEMQ